ADAGDPVPSRAGMAVGGGIQSLPPFRVHFAFSASYAPFGASGEMVFDSVVGTTQQVARVRAHVTCMFVLDNYAEVTGLIDGASPTPGFQYATLTTADNGNPAAS